MRIIGNDPNTPRQTQVVASGTLSTGDTVVVNADGTVSAVEETAAGTGTAVPFESATVSWVAAGFDSNAGKVVVAYMDEGNSNYGTAVVGTVSDTSISFGTPVVFEASAIRGNSLEVVFDSTNNKIVICYSLTGSGKAIVGTVSGATISFGTAVEFEGASADYLDACYYTIDDRIVIAYRDDGNSSYGTAVVGEVSGTSISFGTPVVFESANSRDFGIDFDSVSNRVVVAYMDVGNNFYGTAVVGAVSPGDNSISFGSATVFNNTGFTFYNKVACIDDQKCVIVYKDDDDSDQGTAIVGTIGSSTISFGSEVHFNTAKTEYIDIVHDPDTDKVMVVYEDDGNSSYGTLIEGTVSGTSISFGSEVVFEQAESQYNAVTYDTTNNKTVIAYRDGGNLNYGTAIVFGQASTNLTSENYIGTAKSGAADGDGVVVNTQGNVDTGQTGLTAGQSYYVQTDGTLSTTAGDPSVFAGTAVSATKLIVKG